MENRNDFINSWYGRHKPTFQNFLDFGVRSTEFCRYISGINHIGINSKADTAYYDTKTGKIYHPAIWYTPKYYAEVLKLEPQDAIYAAISFHNGAQIHESLHVKLTPRDFSDKLSKFIKDNGDERELDINWPLVHLCMNIVEDVYIETWGLEKYTHIFTFNRFVNDILFPDERVKSLVEAFQNDTLPDEKERDNALINLLICWKRIENRNRDIYKTNEVKPYIDLLSQSADIGLNLYDRFKIVFALYQLLRENKVNTPQDESAMTSDLRNAVDEFMEATEGELETIEADFDEIFYDRKPSEIVKISDAFTSLEENLKFVFKLDEVGETIKPDSKYHNFARFIQFLRTKKPSYSIAKDEGNAILDRELYRIGIDANVLTTNQTMRIAKGKPQFVILVDSSGSMHRIFKATLQSAMGIYLSLVQNDIPVSMWGHTGYSNPVVYGISAYKMPFQGIKPEITSNPVKAISNALSIDLSQNYDGFAINSLQDKFNSDRSKYLFILSDGLPSGRGYGGASAIEHIQKVCHQLKKKGVNVYSISLTENVSERNDEIYGKQYNIHGYKNLDKEMQKLVLNFV